MRHELSVELIGTHIDTHHERKSSPWPAGAGTRVVMTVPVEVYDKQLVGQRFRPVRLARGFALGNPHVQIEVIANPAFGVVSEEDGFAGDLCFHLTGDLGRSLAEVLCPATAAARVGMTWKPSPTWCFAFPSRRTRPHSVSSSAGSPG